MRKPSISVDYDPRYIPGVSVSYKLDAKVMYLRQVRVISKDALRQVCRVSQIINDLFSVGSYRGLSTYEYTGPCPTELSEDLLQIIRFQE